MFLKLNALMLEFFDEHLILNYVRVTSQTQVLKKLSFNIGLNEAILLFQNYFDVRL